MVKLEIDITDTEIEEILYTGKLPQSIMDAISSSAAAAQSREKKLLILLTEDEIKIIKNSLYDKCNREPLSNPYKHKLFQLYYEFLHIL